MHSNHARLCPSPEWAAYLQGEVLPSVAGDRDLGSELIEVGPGPGASTEWLRHRVARPGAVEIDPVAAGKLADRFGATNVEVVTADATALPTPTRPSTRRARSRCSTTCRPRRCRTNCSRSCCECCDPAA